MCLYSYGTRIEFVHIPTNIEPPLRANTEGRRPWITWRYTLVCVHHDGYGFDAWGSSYRHNMEFGAVCTVDTAPLCDNRLSTAGTPPLDRFETDFLCNRRNIVGNALIVLNVLCKKNRFVLCIVLRFFDWRS